MLKIGRCVCLAAGNPSSFNKKFSFMSDNTSLQVNNRKTYDLKNFNILLAEDYDFMKNLVAMMLKEFGVGNIMTCSDAVEARELLTISMASSGAGVKGIDIVLTDWLMPGGSGPDLLKWIRNHKKDAIRFMPVMLLSAYASENIITVARDGGANEALVKPVSAEKLASRILTVIDRPRPFIKAPDFFGPDRRRQTRPILFDDRRITEAEEIKVHNERL
jgi:CheY-like chemotaxis protein